MYIQVTKSFTWLILLHHMICDWPPLHLHVCQAKRTSVVVKVWKWPHCSVTLRHVSTCSTVSSTCMCVCSQYDTGASTVSGLRWSWLKFNSSVTSSALVSVQPFRLSKFWGHQEWIWLVKNSFSHDVCNARNACTVSVILWTGLMCGSWHTKFWILSHTQLHCYTSPILLLNMYYIIVTIILTSKSCVWH